MSVFAILKKSRQRAKDEAQRQAEKAQVEAAKTPYRHVPTHAAVDALSGAPSSWKYEDRPRILEQNRRRSAMAASGMNMGMPGIPRVASSLSHVTYPSAAASPMVRHIPRAYSYSGVPPMPMPPVWQERSGDVIYSVPDTGSKGSLKGKERERAQMFDSGHGSSSSSKGGSPVASSSNSTSEEDLEMKPSTRHSLPAQSMLATQQQGRPAAVGGYAHRLHPSHPRRASDASMERVDLTPTQSRTSFIQAPVVVDRRPPPSTRGFNSIPPVPALPPMQFSASASGFNQPVASSSASTASIPSTTPPTSLSSFNFTTSNSGPISAHSSVSISAPVTPPAVVAPEPRFEPFAAPLDAPAQSALPVKHKDRRASKVARFTELETIDSTLEKPFGVPYENLPRSDRVGSAPQAVSHAAVNQYMAQQAQAAPQQEAAPPAKNGKRLSKQPAGAKLTKKNRWSMRGSSSAVAV